MVPRQVAISGFPAPRPRARSHLRPSHLRLAIGASLAVHVAAGAYLAYMRFAPPPPAPPPAERVIEVPIIDWPLDPPKTIETPKSTPPVRPPVALDIPTPAPIPVPPTPAPQPLRPPEIVAPPHPVDGATVQVPIRFALAKAQ